MKCPYCKHNELKVLESRDSEDFITRRRRECLKCKKRFTTYERIETIELTVIKKDGKRQTFDKNKILNGLLKACEKRPVTRDTLEKTVDEIELELRNLNTKEISSKLIGKIVLKKLKKLDKVAYIRFCSVYMEFANLESFESELKKLTKH
ncbi:MAG: transcriptional regulator NrdR [Candidatus Woesearchaeota archaeon]